MASVEVLCRITPRYWAHINPDTCEADSFIALDPPKTFAIGAVTPTSGKVLRDEVGIEISPDRTYDVFRDERLLAFWEARSSLARWRDSRSQSLVPQVRYLAERFRRKTRNELLASLEDTNVQLRDLVKAIAHYTFSDHFSFWLYDVHTKHFTCSCSSFPSEYEFVRADCSKSMLGEMLEKKGMLVSRPVERGVINADALKGMHTVNRVWIEAAAAAAPAKVGGVLSLYSHLPEYELRSDSAKLIRSLTSLHLAKGFATYISKYTDLVKLLEESYRSRRFQHFLRVLVKEVRNVLGYEAASVFMIDERSPTHLRLCALSDARPPESPMPDIVYDTESTAKTSTAFREGRIQFSYDIDRDEFNSRVFNESTSHKATNWLGIPIPSNDDSHIGVLRVKNRIEGGNIVHFNSADIDLLVNVASMIGRYDTIEKSLQREQRDTLEKLELTERRNRELNAFVRTFRHEVKSPLTSVTRAPAKIRKALLNSGFMRKGEPEPKLIREVLSDLARVGDRLAFVADAFSIDAKDLVQDIMPTRVLTEVVTPVTNFAEEEAKVRGRVLRIDKASLLLPDILCDSTGASIAVHILIDNALKYSDEGAPIKIWGTNGRTSCSIHVSSQGLPIDEDEKGRIFEQFQSGRAPKAQKIAGSGIGLWLAKEIMELNGGKIALARLTNPTEFRLTFRKSTEYDSEDTLD